ncbi:MAG: hypothetical protein ACOC6I_03185 [Candidatus Bipolaricaulota bacterium]
MKKQNNPATRYSAIKQIYHESYLEDVSHRLRKEAAHEKENCS